MSNSGFTFRRVREEMIETLLDLGIKDFRVLDAISQIPRHIFLDEALWSRAYENRSLTIGYKQTISQPYIVAYMTQAIDPKPTHRVLEIGTGSGYQAAILAELVDTVYTIEIIPELGKRAKAICKELGYNNIQYRIGDGYHGWLEKSPFDASKLGAAMVSKNIAVHLEEFLREKPHNTKLVFYCARGGKRSRSFAQVCSMIGWQTSIV